MLSVFLENPVKLLPQGKHLPSFRDGLLIYFTVLIFLIAIAPLFVSGDVFVGLLASETILLLVPVYFYCRYRKFDFNSTFRLTVCSPLTYVGVVFAGLGGTLFAIGAALLQGMIVPFSENMEEMTNIVLQLYSERGFLLTLIVLALTPAICEEFLFRGLILRGLESQSPPRQAIILTGLLFGIFHLNPNQIIPTTILGIIIGWLVWLTDSIWSGVLIHCLNNAIVVTFISLSGGGNASAHEKGADFSVILLLVGLFALALVAVIVGVGIIKRADKLLGKLNSFEN